MGVTEAPNEYCFRPASGCVLLNLLPSYFYEEDHLPGLISLSQQHQPLYIAQTKVFLSYSTLHRRYTQTLCHGTHDSICDEDRVQL